MHIKLPFNLVEHIRRHGFKRLLLAVSGGLDSICLAHYFIANREALGIEWLGIAHVHHGLREGTADRDAKFVEEFAKSHDVPFFLKRLDGEALKDAEGSLEENARDARYKALVEIAKSIVTLEPTGDRVHYALDPIASARLQDDKGRCPLGGGHDIDPSTSLHSAQDDISLVSRLSSFVSYSPIAIVTAHHAGDQAETMYMRLKRGTTLAGLHGIQEVRVLSNSQGVAGLASEAPLEGVMEDRATGCNQGETSPTQDDKNSLDPIGSSPLQDDKAKTNCLPSTSNFLLRIFRPFLNVTRAELLQYAYENGLSWCEDESNADVKFARNSIRHQLLPHLEKEVPGATKQLCKIATLADKAYESVMRKCENVFGAALCTDIEERRFPNKSGMTVAKGCVTGSFTASLFRMTIAKGNPGTESGMTSFIALDKKKLNKILVVHKEADLSEMFRLWLSEKGFRFPIGFFYGPKEPAHVKIPVHAVFRKRSIVKIRHTVWICEFEDALSAAKFVSCEKK